MYTLICNDLGVIKRLSMLEDINKYRHSMVHSISHELKTPLNGIVNLVQSLTNLKEVTENVKVKYLKPALDCSTLMVQVINDIIDFT